MGNLTFGAARSARFAYGENGGAVRRKFGAGGDRRGIDVLTKEQRFSLSEFSIVRRITP
jgi:hypothetical protein